MDIRIEKLKRSWPILLIMAGTLLLVYVSAQYGRMYLEQRRLAARFHEQQQQVAASQGSPKKISAEETLTRLYIPAIKLDAVVVEGTSRHQLLLGPGHMKQTPAPGENGNSVITAHRDTFFRHIYELHKGDVIVVQRDGKEYHYEVMGKRIVQPDDVSVVKASSDAELTLITCYPTYYIGPAPERLVVFSKLASDSPATPAKSSQQAATIGEAK
ncbi:MAG TPA: class D sortase [Terriglobales bacterium]|nr:class D sortase [Terriglobales bacterium]